MKKVYFLLLILLQGLNALCQTPAALTTPSPDQTAKQTVHRKGFSLEPLAGIGTSEAVQNGTNNLGWKAGCGVVYMFNEHWGISSGLQIQKYSTKIVSGKDSTYVISPNPEIGNPSFWEYNSINAIYHFTYLELPIMLRYLSSHDEKFGFFGEAGFIFGYLVSSSELDSIYSSEIATNFWFNGPTGPTNELSYKSSLPTVTPKATSFNFAGHLTIGLFVPISKRCSIITDVSVNKSFTNIGNSSNDFFLNIPPFSGPLFYYNKNNNVTSSAIFNYGTNFSALFSVRLNIKF